MFNSLNSTGLPLSDGDIISAQLYSKSGEKTEDFNEKWKNINRLTERLGQQKVVSLDSVLQQYMYIRRAIDKSYINGESVDVTMPGLRKYFLNINPKLLDAPIDFCENLEKITMIWDTIKGYQKIKLLLKFNENAKIYLISYLFRFEVNQLDEAMISDIVDCLMRLFAIMELVDSGYSSKHFKTFLFGINIRLVDRSVPISEVIEEFNKHINAAWQKSHITEAI